MYFTPGDFSPGMGFLQCHGTIHLSALLPTLQKILPHEGTNNHHLFSERRQWWEHALADGGRASSPRPICTALVPQKEMSPGTTGWDPGERRIRETLSLPLHTCYLHGQLRRKLWVLGGRRIMAAFSHTYLLEYKYTPDLAKTPCPFPSI